MNVLLLEDNLDLSAVASEQIESRGHRVFPAFDIASARAILSDANIQIDILVADHLIPDGDGTEFAIETKKTCDTVTVVVVSGQLSNQEIERLDASGVDHYDKPALYADVVENSIGKHFRSEG
jgi:DNA-binding response OmpR family regulator